MSYYQPADSAVLKDFVAEHDNSKSCKLAEIAANFTISVKFSSMNKQGMMLILCSYFWCLYAMNGEISESADFLHSDDHDLTLTFQNVAVEAGGEGADVEAPATDAP